MNQFRLNFLIPLSLLTVGCLHTHAAEYRFALLSAQQNIAVDQFDLSEHVGDAVASRWNVTLSTLHGGKQEGVQLITLDNGMITVSVIPTRGMSLYDVRDSETGERIFGWDSPVKEIVHPAFVDLESRGGLGWLEGFNEWMVRCGLAFAGHPGTDKFINNVGDEAEMTLTLHGKVGNIPASEVELIVDRQAPYSVRLRGTVSERMFYGPKLKLVTEMTLQHGTRSIQLNDTLTNEGGADEEYQVIYHTNFGTPVLDRGAKVVVPVAELSPMNEHAAKAIEHYDIYEAPQVDFIEQVYLIKPIADDKGRTMAVLKNAGSTIGASVAWDTKSLPHLTLWKNTAAEQDGYVTGIEPGTGYPFNRRIERHYGRVPKLAPGQSASFNLTFTVLHDPDAVQQAVDTVKQLAGDTTPKVHTEPPANPFVNE